MTLLFISMLTASAQSFYTEPSAGSCFDACGGQSQDGCWCDEYCSFYGDCCDDKADVCEVEEEPVTTCASSCGGQSEDNCWCDESCEAYGDCCDDKADVCDAYAFPVTVTDDYGNQQQLTLIDQDAHAQDNSLDESLQAWRNFVELLVLIGSIDQEELGLNGNYAGHFVDEFGTAVDAGLDINHSGSTVQGSALVLEHHLEIDTGYFCSGRISLPVAAFYIEGQTDGSGWTATGTSSHTINVASWWDVDVDVDWSFSMDQNDLETVTGSVDIDLPAWCSDATLTGRFTRTSIF